MFNIRTAGLLVALSLAFSTAQAERLSLSQLKDMIDQLQGQMAQLEETQNTPSLAGFNCPQGLAVTGFDNQGEPVCTTHWVNLNSQLSFPYPFECVSQFIQDEVQNALTESVLPLLDQLDAPLSRTYTNALGDVTLSNLSVLAESPLSVTASLVESRLAQPCSDEVLITVEFASLSVDGDMLVETSSFTNLSSRFSYQMSSPRLTFRAPLSVVDVTGETLPVVVERSVIDLISDESTVGNSELVLSDFDDSVTNSLVRNLMTTNLLATMSDSLAPVVADTLATLPAPLAVNVQTP